MTKLERIIITKTPLAYFIRKSKHWILPGFDGVPLYDVMHFFYVQIKTVSITERAAAISYNLIMAIPPSFLFLFTLLPHLPFIKRLDLETQIKLLIKQFIPAQGYNDTIINFIDTTFFQSPRIGLISFSLVLALFFASNAMIGIMRSFNKNYIGFEKRKIVHRRWMAIRLTALLFGLFLGVVLFLISQRAALKLIGVQKASIREVIFYMRWVFIVALVFYSIAFIYKFAPSLKKRWKLFSPGAILASTLSILTTLGFSAFVNNFGRYNALYGSIGAVIVIMALIYLNSLVLLIGFELNVSIRSLKSIKDHHKNQQLFR